MNRLYVLLIATFWMLHATATSQAAELTSLTPDGLSANRIDIIFVSEGYTATQESLFNDHIQLVSEQIFQIQPFTAYTSHFKQYALFEASSEEGADHPSLGVFVDTAFNAFYDCQNIPQLICFDNDIVEATVNSLAGAAQRDIIIVLVNDPQPGGSGGRMASMSTAPSSMQLVVHELGHTLGGLADEYTDAYPALNPCNGNVFEPAQLNVTSSAISLFPMPAQIKWMHPNPQTRLSPWFDQLTLFPTTNVAQNQPGLYEGAFYCNHNYFRPTYNSLMRIPGPSFDVINEEILVRRIHDYVSPIEFSFPVVSSFELIQNSVQLFAIQTLSGEDGVSVIEWRLDGLPIGSNSTQVLETASLPPGTYTLEVSVTETTEFVRRDLLGQMTAVDEWQVEITEIP